MPLAPSACPVCGMHGNVGELVPFLTGPGPEKGYTWLHLKCWPTWFKGLSPSK